MKSKSKNITDKNINVVEAIDFESQRNYLIEKSSKRAWLIAFISLSVTLILAIAIIVMLPLKRVDLAVVKVDKNGFVEIVTNLNEQTISKDEALDKYFVGRYVKVREQYYYNTLNQDYESVQRLSDTKVAQIYIEYMIGNNGKMQEYKDKKEIEVTLLSIVLNDSNGVKTATVRIQLDTKDTASNKAASAIKVVTLTYDYLPLKLTSKSRLENPLGFAVTSYRIDEEILR